MAGIIGFEPRSGRLLQQDANDLVRQQGATKESYLLAFLCATQMKRQKIINPQAVHRYLHLSRQQECYATDVGVDTGALIRTVKLLPILYKMKNMRIKHLLRGIFCYSY